MQNFKTNNQRVWCCGLASMGEAKTAASGKRCKVLKPTINQKKGQLTAAAALR